MNNNKRILGFDRKINLDWLDATLHLLAQGLSEDMIRERLDTILEGHVSGTKHNSAKGKTKTVLMHIWVNVPADLVDLRDRAIKLDKLYGSEVQLALHWGMCLATYPFFFDLVLNAGRLLNLQEEISQKQLQYRMAEIWGERSTLTRSVQRLIRNMIQWQIIAEGDQPGHYRQKSKLLLTDYNQIQAWLVEIFMFASKSEVRSLDSVINNPVFFPFNFDFSTYKFDDNYGFEIVRHGAKEDLVVVR